MSDKHCQWSDSGPIKIVRKSPHNDSRQLEWVYLQNLFSIVILLKILNMQPMWLNIILRPLFEEKNPKMQSMGFQSGFHESHRWYLQGLASSSVQHNFLIFFTQQQVWERKGMRSSSGSFHLEITLHPNKHLSFLTLLLLQGIYTHKDDCTRHCNTDTKQIHIQRIVQDTYRYRNKYPGQVLGSCAGNFWPCFFHSTPFVVLVLFFFLNLSGGPVHLVR